jgi:serine/threonine protein kinase
VSNVQPYGEMRLIELNRLAVPGILDGLERAECARRFRTLLLPKKSASLQGGLGKATKAYNCMGETLCIKSISSVPHMGMSELERAQKFKKKVDVFRDEYDCHRRFLGVPGIAQVYGYGMYMGGPVMLMEWVEGISSRGLMPHTKHNGLLCAAFGACVAAVLACAYERDPQFVHRDISCRNVLLRCAQVGVGRQVQSRSFDVRLIDFGSSVCTGSFNGAEGGERAVGWRNATPEYAPPEMLTHSNPKLICLRYSQGIDVYALCSLLWELYTGQTPFRLSERGPSRFERYYQLKLSSTPIVPYGLERVQVEFLDMLMPGLEGLQVLRPSMRELWKTLVGYCGKLDGLAAARLQESLELSLRETRKPVRSGTTIVADG